MVWTHRRPTKRFSLEGDDGAAAEKGRFKMRKGTVGRRDAVGENKNAVLRPENVWQGNLEPY